MMPVWRRARRAAPENEHHQRDLVKWTKWLAICTGALALATFIVALFSVIGSLDTGKLAEAARDSADTAKLTAKAQLRAYAIAGFPTGLDNFAEKGKLKTHGSIENVGQTPVYDLAWIGTLVLADYPVISVGAFPDCSNVRQLPNGFNTFFGKAIALDLQAEWQLSDDQIEKVLSGNSAVVFIGRMCYEDIFRDEDYTNFCFQWHGEGELDAQTGRYRQIGKAAFCARGNEADRAQPSAPINLPEVPYHSF
jgi:hypothetical protein